MYIVFLVIYAIFQPLTKMLIGSTVVILTVAFSHSLRLVVMMGCAMNINYVWEMQYSSSTAATATKACWSKALATLASAMK